MKKSFYSFDSGLFPFIHRFDPDLGPRGLNDVSPRNDLELTEDLVFPEHYDTVYVPGTYQYRFSKIFNMKLN